MMKNLGELFEVEYIDWPHNPNGIPLSVREDPAFEKYYAGSTDVKGLD